MGNTLFTSTDGFNKYLNEDEFDFVKNPEGILQELLQCKEYRNAIGIHSHALGEAMLITGVEDIILEESDTVVVLKPYDTTGYILPNNKISLREIISVCPFKSPIKNPYLENLDKDKSWFF